MVEARQQLQMQEKPNTAFYGYQLLLILIWTQHTVFPYIAQIFRVLPIIGRYYTNVYLFVVLAALIFALPYLMRHIRVTDLLFYFCCVLVVFWTLLFLPKNAEYLSKDAWRILGQTIPLYFAGIAYSHNENKKVLFWSSLIGVGCTFLYQIRLLVVGRELNTDNMYASYNLLPSILYLIYWFFQKKKARYYVCAALVSMLPFIFGTRGPILITFVYLFLLIFIQIMSTQKTIWKVWYLLLVGGGLLFLFSGDTLTHIMQYLSDLFGKIGFSTRIFDFYLEGNIDVSVGRDRLSETIRAAIMQKPFIGHGLMGDWVLLKIYVHNLFLELWCQFGIVLGSALCIWMFWVPLRSFYKNRNDDASFLLLLCCLTFLKLMLSNSYLIEPLLFFMFGVSIARTRERGERYVKTNSQKDFSHV